MASNTYHFLLDWQLTVSLLPINIFCPTSRALIVKEVLQTDSLWVMIELVPPSLTTTSYKHGMLWWLTSHTTQTYTNPLVGYIVIIISPFVTRTVEGDATIVRVRGVRNTSPYTVARSQYKLSSVFIPCRNMIINYKYCVCDSQVVKLGLAENPGEWFCFDLFSFCDGILKREAASAAKQLVITANKYQISTQQLTNSVANFTRSRWEPVV